MKFQKTHFPMFLLILLVVGTWWSFFILEKNEDTIFPPNKTVSEMKNDKWQIYSNDRLGFSVQYPAHWYYEENDGVVFTLFAPEDPKRRSSIGLASTLSINEISKRLSKVSRLTKTAKFRAKSEVEHETI